MPSLAGLGAVFSCLPSVETLGLDVLSHAGTGSSLLLPHPEVNTMRDKAICCGQIRSSIH